MSNLFAVDGAKVKFLRERRGMSQQELATLTCLSLRQVKQIEEGGSSSFYNEDIKRKAMVKMVAVLDVVHATDSFNDDAEQGLELAPVRAEVLHELANPPAAIEEGQGESLSSNQPASAPELHPSTTEREPDAKSNALLWLTVVVALVAVTYGLGLLPIF